jgi:hypothetical protein
MSVAALDHASEKIRELIRESGKDSNMGALAVIDTMA